MNYSRSLAVALTLAASALVVLSACTRTSVPIPVVHDTITVVKHDTTINIDTLYGTPDPSINMKNGLVLYLPFNGSFADSSGSGNTVTAVGGAALDYDMHGYASSAFNATGAGERLIVGNNGAYKVDTAFTVSCDFMIRSNAYYSGGYDFSGLQVFLSIVNVNAGMGATFNLGLSLPNYPQYFTFNVVGAQNNDCSSYATNPAYYISDTTQFIPQIGAWYNAVCVFHKDTTRVYINGKLISTRTNPNISSTLYCSDANFVIGGWWNGGNSGTENLRGKLDEVRFYNRTLNSHEIGWLARNFQPTSVRQTPGAQTGSGSRLH